VPFFDARDETAVTLTVTASRNESDSGEEWRGPKYYTCTSIGQVPSAIRETEKEASWLA